MDVKGFVTWAIGLPGSGKSVAMETLAEQLRVLRVPVLRIDSDDYRKYVTPSLGFGADRDVMYRSMSGVAHMAAVQGLGVLISATAHKRIYRDEARAVALREGYPLGVATSRRPANRQ